MKPKTQAERKLTYIQFYYLAYVLVVRGLLLQTMQIQVLFQKPLNRTSVHKL